MKFILTLLVAACCVMHAEEASVVIQGWVASIEPSGAPGKTRLQLGIPTYVSPADFVAQYQQSWRNSSGVDLLTMSPLAIQLGQGNGMDLFNSSHLTNRTPELYPIPTNQPGLYWRFRADKSIHPVVLDCAFTYDYSQTNKSGQIIAARANFRDKLSFTNDQIAVIRLPTINYNINAPRKFLGIALGRTTKQETREIYIAFGLTNLPTASPPR